MNIDPAEIRRLVKESPHIRGGQKLAIRTYEKIDPNIKDAVDRMDKDNIPLPDIIAEGKVNVPYLKRTLINRLGRSPSFGVMHPNRLSDTEKKDWIKKHGPSVHERDWVLKKMFPLFQKILHSDPPIKGYVNIVKFLNSKGWNTNRSFVQRTWGELHQKHFKHLPYSTILLKDS